VAIGLAALGHEYAPAMRLTASAAPALVAYGASKQACRPQPAQKHFLDCRDRGSICGGFLQ
jgi:hypothetical protein